MERRLAAILAADAVGYSINEQEPTDEEGDESGAPLPPISPPTAKKPTGTLTLHPHKDQAKTFKAALTLAKEITGSDIATVNMEAICIDFLNNADNPNPALKAIDVVRDWMKKTDPQDIAEELKSAHPGSEVSFGTPDPQGST